MYEPALGDVVGFALGGVATVGEVCELPGGSTVGVRVTTPESDWYTQRVYFNAGQLERVEFRTVVRPKKGS